MPETLHHTRLTEAQLHHEAGQTTSQYCCGSCASRRQTRWYADIRLCLCPRCGVEHLRSLPAAAEQRAALAAPDIESDCPLEHAVARDILAGEIRDYLRRHGIDPHTLFAQADYLALSVAEDEAAQASNLLLCLRWYPDPPERTTGRMVLITANRYQHHYCRCQEGA